MIASAQAAPGFAEYMFVNLLWGVLVVCAVLAVPTAWDPYSAAASASYPAGLTIVVAAMWRGSSLLLRSDQRWPWVLLATAATCCVG
jgi:hypothetical protein